MTGRTKFVRTQPTPEQCRRSRAAVARTKAETRRAPIPRERLAHLARRIHRLGEAPLFHLLAELEAGADLHARLEAYARLGDLADFIKQLGGDVLPTARLVTPKKGRGAP